MSDTPPPLAEKKKTITAPRVLVVVVVICLIVIAVLNWSYGVSRSNARRDAYKQGVAALATALRTDYMNQKPVLTKRLITDVAKYGGYDSIEVSNESGKVLAATNDLQQGKTIEAMAKATNETTYKNENGKWVFVCGIYLAQGNRLGAVRVTISP